jgi:hypothetical protein
MELDQLKSDWNASANAPKTSEALKTMLSENRHPVLKEIRKQVVIEFIGWSAFLLCYYTMFDGQEKPIWANLLLINSICCSLIHNAAGYSFSKYLIRGADLKSSLRYYLSKIRNYAFFAVLTRFLSFAGFLVFFTVNIEFNTFKYVMLAVLVLILLAQLAWLSRLWAKRVGALRTAVLAFE